jgi:hypothetical protein
VCVFLLKTKDKTQKTFCTIAKQAQCMLNHEIKAVRTDNGSVFENYAKQDIVQDGVI